MERPETNLVNAGILFMHSVWLQSQMVDLIIFRCHPEFVDEFVSTPKGVPDTVHNLRIRLWKKDFADIKGEFLKTFESDLTADEKEQIERAYTLRNMIAHAHVSLGRDYMLYRPSSEKREKAVLDAWKPAPVEEQSNPLMFKLEFWEPERFKAYSDDMAGIDQICFKRLAEIVGVPHGRIR